MLPVNSGPAPNPVLSAPIPLIGQRIATDSAQASLECALRLFDSFVHSIRLNRTAQEPAQQTRMARHGYAAGKSAGVLLYRYQRFAHDVWPLLFATLARLVSIQSNKAAATRLITWSHFEIFLKQCCRNTRADGNQGVLSPKSPHLKSLSPGASTNTHTGHPIAQTRFATAVSTAITRSSDATRSTVSVKS